MEDKKLELFLPNVAVKKRREYSFLSLDKSGPFRLGVSTVYLVGHDNLKKWSNNII